MNKEKMPFSYIYWIISQTTKIKVASISGNLAPWCYWSLTVIAEGGDICKHSLVGILLAFAALW